MNTEIVCVVGARPNFMKIAPIMAAFAKHGVTARIQGLGARFGVYFDIADEVRNYGHAQRHNRAKMLKFIAIANRHGVYFHDYGGAACHHGFCHALSLDDAAEVLRRLDIAIGELASQAA